MERSMTSAHMDQMARDICLSAPKHPPKFSAEMHGGCRLFGEAALIPLHSQVGCFSALRLVYLKAVCRTE